MADIDSDEDGVFVSDPVLPEEKMRKLLYQIIAECQTITADEMAYLCESVKLVDVRY